MRHGFTRKTVSTDSQSINLKQRYRVHIPNLIVGVLLLVSVAVFAVNAHRIVTAEESEEDFSKILVLSEAYISGLQKTQLHLHQYFHEGDEQSLDRFKQERERSVNRLATLRELIAEDFAELIPQIAPAEGLQRDYLKALDESLALNASTKGELSGNGPSSAKSSQKLFQIELVLDQIQSGINLARNDLNDRVALNIRLAGISIAFVAILLMIILAIGFRVTSRALATNRRLAAKLEQEATHDALTHLPNRRMFLKWIDRALADAGRNQFSTALYFIDLDGFKAVNDRLGHDAGDEVLRAVATRFQTLLRESDLLVRLGGDEFAVAVTHANDNASLSVLAGRMIASLDAPIPIGPEEAKVGASIGIAVFPRDANNSDELLKAADASMYQAKQGGKNRYCFSSADKAL